MNTGQDAESAWTPRQWGLGLILALALQFTGIFWFSGFPTSTPKRAVVPTRVRFAPANPAGQSAYWKPERTDPTLFALVTPEGFSGSAWLTVPRFQYEATNQPQALHWLTLPTEELADDFADFVQTNSIVEEVIPEPPPPALAKPTFPTPLVVASTDIKLAGDLAGSRIVSSGPVPRLAEPLLTNSIVRVLIDPEGWPLSAALVSSSGVAQADQEALGYVKGARFGRLGKGREAGSSNGHVLAFGSVVFQWAQVRWSQGGASTKGERAGL